MLYNQYKCLQQYVNGVAQDVYKKGDLVKTADFVSLKACEKDDGLSTNCFSWSYIQTEGTTETYIYYKIDEKSYTSRVSPACIDTPSISLAFSCGSGNCTNHNWNIKTLNVKHIDTSQVVSLKEAFYDIRNLKELDLSTWNTSNVETMEGMFLLSNLDKINVSSFNTSKVQNMNFMFALDQHNNLTSLDVSNFDTSKCETLAGMFRGCDKLTTLNLSNFNTINCTNVQMMFAWCYSLSSLDVSNFDMSKVGNKCGSMLSGCDKLKHIKCTQAFKDWCITNQDSIGLPSYMRNGGSGTWEIVG